MPQIIPKSQKLPAISEADYKRLAAFRNALRDFLHFSEQAALAAGIPPQQHQAMLVIRGAPGRDSLAVGEIARRLKIRHHSAVGLVDRMETDRLITKSRDPKKHRQVLIRLTARGNRALAKLSPVHKAELARIGPTLRKILEHLESSS